MTEVNDAQSRLNPTYVKSILTPRSEEEVRKFFESAKQEVPEGTGLEAMRDMAKRSFDAVQDLLEANLCSAKRAKTAGIV